MSDIVSAVMTILTNAGVEAYGVRLPDGVVRTMPRKVASVVPQGGAAMPWHYEVDVETVEVRCYGADSVEALETYRAVMEALHSAYMVTVGSVTVLAATKTSGPIYGVEPEAEWEFVSATFQVQLRLDS